MNQLLRVVHRTYQENSGLPSPLGESPNAKLLDELSRLSFGGPLDQFSSRLGGGYSSASLFVPTGMPSGVDSLPVTPSHEAAPDVPPRVSSIDTDRLYKALSGLTFGKCLRFLVFHSFDLLILEAKLDETATVDQDVTPNNPIPAPDLKTSSLIESKGSRLRGLSVSDRQKLRRSAGKKLFLCHFLNCVLFFSWVRGDQFSCYQIRSSPHQLFFSCSFQKGRFEGLDKD